MLQYTIDLWKEIDMLNCKLADTLIKLRKLEHVKMKLPWTKANIKDLQESLCISQGKHLEKAFQIPTYLKITQGNRLVFQEMR